ncbi:hypothetical protein HY406_01760, partial [Candidatus Giovannonibacteria bacterium]|nr:hypothetical protein [Candidatus Giovannonibacteria bacterium]
MKKIFLIAIVILLVVLLGVFFARRRAARVSFDYSEYSEESVPAELKFPTEPSASPSVPVTLPKPEAPAVPRREVVLAADFSEKAGEVRWAGSGFLVGLDAYSSPPDAKIIPLKPRLWRHPYLWTPDGVNLDL